MTGEASPPIIGTETEFGITVRNQPDFNPVLGSSLVINSYAGARARIQFIGWPSCRPKSSSAFLATSAATAFTGRPSAGTPSFPASARSFPSSRTLYPGAFPSAISSRRIASSLACPAWEEAPPVAGLYDEHDHVKAAFSAVGSRGATASSRRPAPPSSRLPRAGRVPS